MVQSECKMEKQNSQLEHGQPMACFACATQVWLAVINNTGITTGE